jgi:3-oxoacyl-[acyl-carrier protein] reductase
MMQKIFIITGTRKGIGKALAEHYLSLGHTVAGCSRGKASLEHANYEHFSLDVSDRALVSNMVRQVGKRHGHIDILLNNAGIASMNHLLTTPNSITEKVFDTNFKGTFLFTREVSKKMIKRKSGHIINFTSVAVPLKLEGEAVYASSKAAVETFTQVSAKELSDFGIRVNAVGPTPVPTDLIRNIPKEKIDRLMEQQAIRRLGNVADIINVIDFLTHEKSDFITGQIIYLGGVMK